MFWDCVATVFFLLSFFLFARELTVLYDYSLSSFYTNHGNDSRFSSFYRVYFPKRNSSSFLEEYITRTIPFGSIRSLGRIQVPFSNKENAKRVSSGNGTGKITKRKLNKYEQKVLKKKQQRDNFLELLRHQQDKGLEEEQNNTRYVIFYPIEAGFGNLVSVLAEAIVVSFITNRHFYSSPFSRHSF